MPDDFEDIAAPAADPGKVDRSFGRTWLLISLAFFAVLSMWSLASPMGSRSDEAAHIVKAAGLYRGQFIGTAGTNLFDLPANRTFMLPGTYGANALACSDFIDVTKPSGCSNAMKSDPTVQATESYTGRYPPLYYLLVGFPSAFGSSPWLEVAMRIVSSLFSAIALGLAGAAALCWLRSRIVAAAVVLAASPMVLFLSSGINPNGLELTAGIAAWVCGLAVLRRRAAEPTTAMVVAATAALGVMASMRALSVLWALGIIVTLVVLDPKAARQLAKLRRIRWAGLILGIVFALDLAYVVVAKAYLLRRGSPDRVAPHDASFWDRLHIALRGFYGPRRNYPSQLISVNRRFAPPMEFRILIAVVLISVIAAGVFYASRRGKVVILGIIVLSALASLVIPLANQSRAGNTGNTWNARYIYPYLVGALFVAAWEWGKRSRVNGSMVPSWVAGLMSVGTLACWYAMLIRHMIGQTHGWNPFTHRPDAWVPYLSAPLLIAVSLGGTIWLCWLLTHRARPAPLQTTQNVTPASSDHRGSA